MKLVVVGAGAWGTTLASLASVRAETSLWAREPEVVDSVTRLRENRLFLPGFRLPDDVAVTGDLEEALAEGPPASPSPRSKSTTCAVDARTWSGACTNRHLMAMGSARGGCSPKGCRNGTGDLGASLSTLDRLRGDSGGDIVGLVFGFRLERQ